jgi:hypothetical protein
VGCVVAVAAAGCGTQSFADQANKICKTYTAKAKAIPQPTSPAGIAGYVDKVAPLLTAGTNKLAALKPPSDKRAQFDALIATARREATLLTSLKRAAQTNNLRAVQTIATQAVQLNAQDSSQAKALGLTSCAKG